MKITREQLRLWGACYDDARIAELVPAEGLTPLEVADLKIPSGDRLWVLLREDIIPARELRLLACGWAEAACHAAGWDDERSIAAIAVARRFSVGEASESERSAAEAEALAAAADADWASGSAAWASAASAWPTAADVDWAAWRAASAAARSSAKAWAKARAEQLADVVRVLRESEGGIKE